MGNQSIWLLLVSLTIADTAHARSLSEIFRDWLLGPEVQASILPSQTASVDAGDQRCMACHNGVVATNITAKNTSSPLQFRGMQTVNHPTGMDYDSYALDMPWAYQPRISLDPNIHLVDGKVGCVSCHRLKQDSQQPLHTAQLDQAECLSSKEWTVGPRETDLCLACHIK